MSRSSSFVYNTEKEPVYSAVRVYQLHSITYILRLVAIFVFLHIYFIENP